MPNLAEVAPESLADLPGLLERAEGWPALVSALGNNGSGVIDGAWGSSCALAAAALARAAPTSLLVVLAHPGDVDPWARDLQSFTGSKPVLFPAWEEWPPHKTLLDDVAGQRLRIVQKLATNPPRLILTTIAGLMQPVPSRTELAERGRRLKKGEAIDVEEVLQWFVDHGFKRVDAVELPGEFSKRGGILDVFSPDAEAPYRVELFGDEIDSIRSFSAQTQRSLDDLQEILILGAPSGFAFGSPMQGARPKAAILTDHLPTNSWVALIEPNELQEQGKFFLETVADFAGLFNVQGVFSQLVKFPNVTISAMPRPSVEQVVHLRVESVERFSGNVTRVRDELDAVAQQDRVLIACHNEAEVHRLQQVLEAGKLAESHRLRLVTGFIRAGFRLVEHGVIVLGSNELFHRELTPAGEKPAPGAVLPKRRIESRAIDSFLELNEGDLVVHVVHGIARYRGMKMLPRSHGAEREMRADEDESESLPV